MNHFNSREATIGEGLLDDGEGARDHGLAGDDGCEHSHNEHWPVERTYKIFTSQFIIHELKHRRSSYN